MYQPRIVERVRHGCRSGFLMVRGGDYTPLFANRKTHIAINPDITFIPTIDNSLYAPWTTLLPITESKLGRLKLITVIDKEFDNTSDRVIVLDDNNYITTINNRLHKD